jgi:hypothetical protein
VVWGYVISQSIEEKEAKLDDEILGKILQLTLYPRLPSDIFFLLPSDFAVILSLSFSSFLL